MDLFLGQGKQGRFRHELGGQLEHVRRIRGGKQAGVDALFGQIALHFLHVRVKTDGQHAVGLVKDQHTQVLEVQRAAQQVVQHAARRAHNDLGPLAQGVHLFFVAHATVHGHGPDAGIRENHGGLAFHLHGQLTRGSEHQGLRGLEFRIQAGQHGQQIAAGLAAARA